MLVLVSLTTGCSQPLPVEQPQLTATAQPTEQNARSFFNQGMVHMPQGDAIDLAELDKAIASFDQAIQIRPDFAEAYYYRGIAISTKDGQERAIADFDKAIQLRPRYLEAYRAGGWAYESKGDSDKAFADFNKVIELFPGLAEAYLNRASLCYGKWNDEWGEVYRMVRMRMVSHYDRALADCDEENKLTPEITETRQSRADRRIGPVGMRVVVTQGRAWG